MKYNIYLYKITTPNNLSKISNLSRTEITEVLNKWWNYSPENDAMVIPVTENESDILSDAIVNNLDLETFVSTGGVSYV